MFVQSWHCCCCCFEQKQNLPGLWQTLHKQAQADTHYPSQNMNSNRTNSVKERRKLFDLSWLLVTPLFSIIIDDWSRLKSNFLSKNCGCFAGFLGYLERCCRVSSFSVDLLSHHWKGTLSWGQNIYNSSLDIQIQYKRNIKSSFYHFVHVLS